MLGDINNGTPSSGCSSGPLPSSQKLALTLSRVFASRVSDLNLPTAPTTSKAPRPSTRPSPSRPPPRAHQNLLSTSPPLPPSLEPSPHLTCILPACSLAQHCLSDLQPSRLLRPASVLHAARRESPRSPSPTTRSDSTDTACAPWAWSTLHPNFKADTDTAPAAPRPPLYKCTPTTPAATVTTDRTATTGRTVSTTVTADSTLTGIQTSRRTRKPPTATTLRRLTYVALPAPPPSSPLRH